jgi:hypothetical protein
VVLGAAGYNADTFKDQKVLNIGGNVIPLKRTNLIPMMLDQLKQVYICFFCIYIHIYNVSLYMYIYIYIYTYSYHVRSVKTGIHMHMFISVFTFILHR